MSDEKDGIGRRISAGVGLRISVSVGLGALALTGACDSGVPKPLCVLRNPETGEKAKMYPEIWYKVPADYDRRKHLEAWKAQQRTAGFTEEVRE